MIGRRDCQSAGAGRRRGPGRGGGGACMNKARFGELSASPPPAGLRGAPGGAEESGLGSGRRGRSQVGEAEGPGEEVED